MDGIMSSIPVLLYMRNSPTPPKEIGFTATLKYLVNVYGTRRPTRSTLTRRLSHAYHYTHSALTLYILSRGAFGGPSPASLTACTAPPPPRPPSPTRPHPPHAPYPALIYIYLCRARQTHVLHVGVGRSACRTRVGDRHARVAGCGNLGRKSP